MKLGRGNERNLWLPEQYGVGCVTTITFAVKSLNRMSQVWDNSTVTAVQCWGLAQSVEHAAVNRSVVGSSPTGGVFCILKSA